MSARWEAVRELRRNRPRSRFLELSIVVLLVGAIASFASGFFRFGDLFQARRGENLRRFLTEDAWPAGVETLGGLVAFVADLVARDGARGLLPTLWIAVLAIVLAGLAAVPPAFLGARTLMRPDPYGRESVSLAWRATSSLVRLASVIARSIPEYVLAFLLLGFFGLGAWPAVLALAVHNAGILGRLGADTLENSERAPLASFAALGARRSAIGLFAAGPRALPRAIAYVSYRFETCVREGTVLGLLGIVSLGYFVGESRARGRYDEMLVWIALGGVLVLGADLASLLARRWTR